MGKKAEELGEEKYERYTPKDLLEMYNNKLFPRRKDSLKIAYVNNRSVIQKYKWNMQMQNPNVPLNESVLRKGL